MVVTLIIYTNIDADMSVLSSDNVNGIKKQVESNTQYADSLRWILDLVYDVNNISEVNHFFIACKTINSEISSKSTS